MINGAERVRSTTILAVRHNAQAVMVGDGQVTLGNVVMKHDATDSDIETVCEKVRNAGAFAELRRISAGARIRSTGIAAAAGFPVKRGGTFRWGARPEPWTFHFSVSPRITGPTSLAKGALINGKVGAYMAAGWAEATLRTASDAPAALKGVARLGQATTLTVDSKNGIRVSRFWNPIELLEPPPKYRFG